MGRGGAAADLRGKVEADVGAGHAGVSVEGLMGIKLKDVVREGAGQRQGASQG